MRLKTCYTLLLNLLLASTALGQPKPVASWVKVPEVLQPTPPLPVPGAVPKLSADELYVLDASEPCFLLVSPPGIVSVSQDAGPIKVRGKFVGGSGKYETRTFTGKAVFIVEAVGVGRVELLVVKEGAKSPADVFRQMIDANVGPLPPPVPPTPPDPPKPPSPADKLGFTELARTELLKLPAAVQLKAGQLADNFEAVAARLAATAQMTVDQANAELRDRNRQALGETRATWLPWFAAWQALADKHNTSGTMTTREHYVTAYRETAAGLRSVQH